LLVGANSEHCLPPDATVSAVGIKGKFGEAALDFLTSASVSIRSPP
jgi:hypothetical protein